uniref:Reverse transcriptase zinc-binding domain-containing protein n=1 Tax=Setaria italica TaxID=4555 RepID=K3Y1D4_SETIT
MVIPNLRLMGLALQMRWLWLTHTDGDKTWSGFTYKEKTTAKAFFNASMTVQVGDGTSALSWMDRWINGYSIKTLALDLWAAVPTRVRNTRTVRNAIQVLSKFIWKGSPTGLFSSASACRALFLGWSPLMGVRQLWKVQAHAIGQAPFTEWWIQARKRVAKTQRKGFDSLDWMVAWSLWKEQNRWVYEWRALQLVALAPVILEEVRTWVELVS